MCIIREIVINLTAFLFRTMKYEQVHDNKIIIIIIIIIIINTFTVYNSYPNVLSALQERKTCQSTHYMGAPRYELNLFVNTEKLSHLLCSRMKDLFNAQHSAHS